MKNARIIGALGAVAVLGGGIVGFVVWRGGAEREEAVGDLLRAVDSELATETVDRESIRRVLRRVRDARKEDPRDELLQAEAKLSLRLDQARDAWEALAGRAMAPDATPENLRLGALAMSRMYATSGDSVQADRAMSLAERHYEAVGAVASLFLKWQLAYRATALERLVDARRRLLEDHAGTPEARFVELASRELANHLADRLGIRGDTARFRELAAAPEGSTEGTLGRLVVDADEAGAKLDRASLERLERAWPTPPPELEVLLAMADIGTQRIADAAKRLQSVIARVPIYLEARHALAIAYVGLGQGREEPCIAQLKWLLDNAPADDVRRRTWEALLQR